MPSKPIAYNLTVTVFALTACFVLHAQENADTSTPSILVTDFTACQPSEVLSNDLEQGKWRQITYSTADFSGTMVGALSFINAQELTLPLGQSSPVGTVESPGCSAQSSLRDLTWGWGAKPGPEGTGLSPTVPSGLLQQPHSNHL